MIIEFKEFFLRHTKVFSGNKADQEVNFPVSGMVDTCAGKLTKYNRLLAADYASDDVIKKLIESITFKLNPEDTATEDIQGLTLKANDIEAATNSVDTSQFTRTLQVHQLPVIVNASGTKQHELYYDLNLNIIYHDISDAIASGNPFAKAYVSDGSGGNGNVLLAAKAYDPTYKLSAAPSAVKLVDTITTVIVNTMLNTIGNVIKYDFKYILSGSSETDVVNIDVVVDDGITKTVIYNFNGAVASYSSVLITLQKTNNDTFLVTANSPIPSYIPIPTTPTFDIYLEVTVNGSSSTEREFELLNFISELKTL